MVMTSIWVEQRRREEEARDFFWMVALSLLLHVLALLALLYWSRFWPLRQQEQEAIEFILLEPEDLKPPEEAELVSEVDSRDGGERAEAPLLRAVHPNPRLLLARRLPHLLRRNPSRLPLFHPLLRRKLLWPLLDLPHPLRQLRLRLLLGPLQRRLQRRLRPPQLPDPLPPRLRHRWRLLPLLRRLPPAPHCRASTRAAQGAGLGSQPIAACCACSPTADGGSPCRAALRCFPVGAAPQRFRSQ